MKNLIYTLFALLFTLNILNAQQALEAWVDETQMLHQLKVELNLDLTLDILEMEVESAIEQKIMAFEIQLEYDCDDCRQEKAEAKEKLEKEIHSLEQKYEETEKAITLFLQNEIDIVLPKVAEDNGFLKVVRSNQSRSNLSTELTKVCLIYSSNNQLKKERAKRLEAFTKELNK